MSTSNTLSSLARSWRSGTHIFTVGVREAFGAQEARGKLDLSSFAMGVTGTMTTAVEDAAFGVGVMGWITTAVEDFTSGVGCTGFTTVPAELDTSLTDEGDGVGDPGIPFPYCNDAVEKATCDVGECDTIPPTLVLSLHPFFVVDTCTLEVALLPSVVEIAGADGYTVT